MKPSLHRSDEESLTDLIRNATCAEMIQSSMAHDFLKACIKKRTFLLTGVVLMIDLKADFG